MGPRVVEVRGCLGTWPRAAEPLLVPALGTGRSVGLQFGYSLSAIRLAVRPFLQHPRTFGRRSP